MAYYVGLDVSVKETSICIMDDKGVVAARTDVSTDPDLIAQFISKHASEVERVVHESGILAIWLTRELEQRGVPIICIDARLAHKALSGRINKSDQGDAEGLAHLAANGLVHSGPYPQRSFRAHARPHRSPRAVDPHAQGS